MLRVPGNDFSDGRAMCVDQMRHNSVMRHQEVKTMVRKLGLFVMIFGNYLWARQIGLARARVYQWDEMDRDSPVQRQALVRVEETKL